MQTQILSLSSSRTFSLLLSGKQSAASPIWRWKEVAQEVHSFLAGAGLRSGWAAAYLKDGVGAIPRRPGEQRHQAVARGGGRVCTFHRAVVSPGSFSGLACSWPASCGPSGTRSLSVLWGRFLLLESSPAEESVDPSKSFPSDTPMNSVKE